MADEFFVLGALFVILFPRASISSIQHEKLWKRYCISQGNYSVCRNSYTQLSQQMCGITDLLNFEDWGFMPISVLRQTFPVDQETKNFVRQVHNVAFSTVHPVPLRHKPSLVAISSHVLTEILDLRTAASAESPAFLEFVAGNLILPNSLLLSHRYGGHQVGSHYQCAWLYSWTPNSTLFFMKLFSQVKFPWESVYWARLKFLLSASSGVHIKRVKLMKMLGLSSGMTISYCP